LFFVYKYCLHGHCRQLNMGDFLRGLLEAAPSSIRKRDILVTCGTYMGYFASNNVVTFICLSFRKSFVHFLCFPPSFIFLFVPLVSLPRVVVVSGQDVAHNDSYNTA
jgi:hypothetical protein